jgi:hypothetical protein
VPAAGLEESGSTDSATLFRTLREARNDRSTAADEE